MTTREEVKAVVLYLKSAFPNYNPAIDGQYNAIDVNLDILRDLDSRMLWMAVKTCCAEPGRQFAPSAGEIRGAVVDIRAKAAGFPDVAQAWGIVVQSFGVPIGDAWFAWKEENPLIDH